MTLSLKTKGSAGEGARPEKVKEENHHPDKKNTKKFCIFKKYSYFYDVFCNKQTESDKNV
jgi:hypothetical protein